MPEYLLSAPCLDLVEQEVGVVEVVPEEPILHLVMQGRRWRWLSQGTHPPPIRKVTFWSPFLAFLLPDGCPQGIGAGLLGDAFNLWSVISWWRSSTRWHSLWSARLPSSAWRQCRVSPLGWGLSWGEWGSPSSSEGGDKFWRVPSHCYNICFDMGFWRGHSPIGNGLASQLRCFNSSACSTLHFLCWAEQSYRFHHRVTEHTQGIGVAHFHAYFDDVLFSEITGIKLSAIFPCNDKKTHSTFKIGFIRWNTISARGSGRGCGGHIFLYFWELLNTIQNINSHCYRIQ